MLPHQGPRQGVNLPRLTNSRTNEPTITSTSLNMRITNNKPDADELITECETGFI